MAIVSLDDRSGRIDVTIFADVYAAQREKLVKDAILVVEGEVSNDDYNNGALKISAASIETLAEARQSRVSGLHLVVSADQVNGAFSNQLASYLAPFKDGPCKVRLTYKSQDSSVDIVLGSDWSVNPDDDLVQALRTEYGTDHVNLTYGH